MAGSNLFLYIVCAVVVITNLVLSFTACGATAKSFQSTDDERHIFHEKLNYNAPLYSATGKDFGAEILKHHIHPNSQKNCVKPGKQHELQKANMVNSHYRRVVYRTYGVGRAVIPHPEATMLIKNMVKDRKVQKEIINDKELDPPAHSKNTFERRKDCTGCPPNRVVMAAKGNSFVILPEPCSTIRWTPMIGPQPGATLREGTHSLIGRLGTRGKVCRYYYKVVVRRCQMFHVEGGDVNCTAGDAWGSICRISCKEGRKLKGASSLKCQDSLTWSGQAPKCEVINGCRWPQTPDDAKIWCKVSPNDANAVEEILPPETICRFKTGGKRSHIKCVAGYWVHGNGNNERGRLRSRNIKNKKKRIAMSKRIEKPHAKLKQRVRNIYMN